MLTRHELEASAAEDSLRHALLQFLCTRLDVLPSPSVSFRLDVSVSVDQRSSELDFDYVLSQNNMPISGGSF